MKLTIRKLEKRIAPVTAKIGTGSTTQGVGITPDG
jgi:hypothetical protein